MDAFNVRAIELDAMEAGEGVDSQRGTAVKPNSLVSPRPGLPVCLKLALAVASAIYSHRLRLPLKTTSEQHCGCAFVDPRLFSFVERAIGLHEGMLEVKNQGMSSTLPRQVCSEIRCVLKKFFELSQPVFLWPKGIKALLL